VDMPEPRNDEMLQRGIGSSSPRGIGGVRMRRRQFLILLGGCRGMATHGAGASVEQPATDRLLCRGLAVERQKLPRRYLGGFAGAGVCRGAEHRPRGSLRGWPARALTTPGGGGGASQASGDHHRRHRYRGRHQERDDDDSDCGGQPWLTRFIWV
jgi:hypothetical protein